MSILGAHVNLVYNKKTELDKVEFFFFQKTQVYVWDTGILNQFKINLANTHSLIALKNPLFY